MNFSANTSTHQNRHLETTEWEDVLVKHGVISEREEIVAARAAKQESAARTERQVEDEDLLASKSLEELDAVEDEFEEDLLRKMRDARLKELAEKAKGEKYGEVYPITKADFIREVTEDSKKCWVVVEMFKDGIQESTKASDLLRQLAAKQKATKFVRIRSTDCVENWPDSSVPCFFLYHDGVMQKQIVGLDFCGGAAKATVESLELGFALHDVFEIDLSDVEAAIAEKLGVGVEGDKNRDDIDDDSDVLKGSATGRKVADLPSQPSASRSVKLADLGDDDDW
mmetsp:Transcript_6259/g.11137  ORF Transcript_6259/g.11137 Transcript_6259/m.11137 type:complete len:283 (+) Transcript_6259:130-978(+)